MLCLHNLDLPPVCALSVHLKRAASIRNTDTGMFGDLSDPFCAVHVYDQSGKRLKKKKTQIAKNSLSAFRTTVTRLAMHLL